MLDVGLSDSDGKKDLSNGHTSGLTQSFTESTSHSLLKSIGSSAGEHLVDSNHVPWLDSHTQVEIFLTAVDLHVLVGSNSGGLKSFGSDLLLLIAHHVDAVWEIGVGGLLLTAIVDSQLGVGDTSVESGLGVRLVLLVSVTPGWSSSHLMI